MLHNRAVLPVSRPRYHCHSISAPSNQRDESLRPHTVSSHFLVSVSRVTTDTDHSGGYAADSFGRLNILYPTLVLSGLFCLAIWLPATSPNVIIAFACMYGFTSGIFISVMPAATGQIIPEEKLGARLGAFDTVAALPVFMGTPVAGALIREETIQGYYPLIIFSVGPAQLAFVTQRYTNRSLQGCSLIAGGIITLVARALHDKKLTVKW